MSAINTIQDEIIENFSLFENDQDKYAYLIDLGKNVTALPDTDKIDENIVRGCQSKVWLTTRIEEGQIHYQADSDALIVKGLISLLLQVLSGQTPQAITKAELYFVEKIGLKQMLSMTRSNGLAAMIKKMKLYAIAYQAKTE